MEKPHYKFEAFANYQYYYFESIGATSIPKVVAYVSLENDESTVELIFGNLTVEGYIDTIIKSSNEDMILILSTVMTTVFDYLTHFPNKRVYFRGSTPSRTRLYRAAISKIYSKIEPFYKVYGLKEDNYSEPFQKNTTYLGFLITKKNG